MSAASLATVSQPRRPHRSHSGTSNPSFDAPQPCQTPTPSSSRPSSVKGRTVTGFQEIALRPAPVPVYTGRLKNRAVSNNVIPVYPCGPPHPTPPPRSYSGSSGFRTSKKRLHDEAQFISQAGRYTVDNPGYDNAINKLLTKRPIRALAQPPFGANSRSRSSVKRPTSPKGPPTLHQHQSQHLRRHRYNDPPETSSSVSVEAHDQEERFAANGPSQLAIPRPRSESNLSEESQQDISALYALAGAFLAANPVEEVPIKKYSRVVQMLNESWEELSKVKPDTPESSEVGSSRTRANSSESTQPDITVLRRTFSVPPVDFRSASHKHLKRSKSVGPRNGLGPSRKENRSYGGYPHNRTSSSYGPYSSESRRLPAKGILRYPVASCKRFGSRARFDESHLFQNTVNSRLRKIMRDLEPDKVRPVPKAKLVGRPVEFRQRIYRSTVDPVQSSWAPVNEGSPKRIYYRSDEVEDERRSHPQGVDGNYENLMTSEAHQDSYQPVTRQPLPPLQEASPVPVGPDSVDIQVSSEKEEVIRSGNKSLPGFLNDKPNAKTDRDSTSKETEVEEVESKFVTVVTESPVTLQGANVQISAVSHILTYNNAITIGEQQEEIPDAVIVLKEKTTTSKHRKSNVPAFASGKPLFNLLPISFYDPQVAQPRSSVPSNMSPRSIWRRARVFLCMGRKRQQESLNQLEAQHSSQNNVSSGEGSPAKNPSTPTPSSESTLSQVRAALEDSFAENLSDDLVDFEDLSYAPEIGVGSLRLTEREGYFEPEKRLCRPSY